MLMARASAAALRAENGSGSGSGRRKMHQAAQGYSQFSSEFFRVQKVLDMHPPFGILRHFKKDKW